MQHAPDVVAVLDANGRAVSASPSAAEAVGVPAEELVRASIFDFVDLDDLAQMQAQFQQVIVEPDRVLPLECRIVGGGGDLRWFDFTVPNHLLDPSLAGAVNSRDITDAKTYQERLARLAMQDALTGLANRRYMHDTLRVMLRDTPVEVLFIDLDGFKRVNDDFGHQAGDEVLGQVADRIAALMRPHELLARIGGDKFIVLVPGVPGVSVGRDEGAQ